MSEHSSTPPSDPVIPAPRSYAELLTLQPPRGTVERGETEILTRDAERMRAEAAMRERNPSGPPAVSRSGVVYRDPHVTVLRDAVRRIDGSLDLQTRMLYTGAEGPTAGVLLLPLIGDRLLFVHQWRHALQMWTLEAPRGRLLDPTEGAPEAVTRELCEEAGGVLHGDLHPLGRLAPESGLISGHVLVYLARIAVETAPSPEAEKEIFRAPVLLRPDAVAAHIASGQIEDALTLAALTRAVIRGFLPPAVFNAASKE